MASLLQSSASPSVQNQIHARIEGDLFGGPIQQTAPEIASLGDASALSDAVQLGGVDYGFYADPGSQQGAISSSGSGDPVQDFINALTPSDMSEYGSDVGYT